MATGTPGDPACRIASRSDAGELSTAIREATDAAVRSVGTTGASALEPLLLVSRDGTTAFFAECTAAGATDVVSRLDDGGLPEGEADAVVDHDEQPGGLPVPPLSPLDLGTRSVLSPCGWVRPTVPEDYRSAGGFATLSTDASDLREAARAVPGRGWGDASADEPVGETWDGVAAAGGDPAVVVNAHGSPGDALVLESAPFLALEGALAAARAVGAGDVVVYLVATADLARERVETAVEELPDEGRSGIDVRVHTGPDEHRAAEPTMALEAIEGNHRLEARLRPPAPDTEGLHGRPTLIHTPRTLAQVVRAAGGASPTRLVTVRGDGGDARGDGGAVRGDEEATIELPEGASLSVAGDAVDAGGSVKAACVGGQFGGLTPDLDIAASADDLAAAGLGTDGVVDLLGEDRCVVAYVGEKARYGKAENCGRCVPCREGSTQLTALLREVYDGSFRRGDVEELLRVMRSTSVCAFGSHMTRPVATALEHFEAEFAAHADGRCPAGACPELPREVAA